jgi:hypothetical protein
MNDDAILGVIGDAEYALVRGDVYRRPAAHAGTYGGWRWECTLEHAKLYPTVYPNGEIVERVTVDNRA